MSNKSLRNDYNVNNSSSLEFNTSGVNVHINLATLKANKKELLWAVN